MATPAVAPRLSFSARCSEQGHGEADDAEHDDGDELAGVGAADRAEPHPDGVHHAGLRVGGRPGDVHEPPDDPGADEGDRHRQEDQRLGDVLALRPVGEHGDAETEGGGQRR